MRTMTNVPIVVLATGIALASTQAACATSTGDVMLSRQQVVEDLTFLEEKWAPKERSFDPAARKRMLSFVDDRIGSAKSMQKTSLALQFAEAEAMADNAHTYSELFAEEGLFHALPVSFWEFPEGAIVTRAHPQFKHLLGAKVLAIGGKPFARAAQLVDRYIPGPAQRKRYLEPSWLTRIEVLQAVGLADGAAARFDFELASGQRKTERLGAAPSADPASQSPAWRASMVPGKGPDPWPHALDSLQELPLFARPPDEFTATALDDGRLLYIRSTSLSPYKGEITVMLKAYAIVDQAVKSGSLPHDIVVDLRYNEGGNFFNIIAFARELSQMVGPEGRIYVIQGRATFSAAIAFAALLKAGTNGRTVIVGEEPSDRLSFWSEGDTLRAPASKLPLRYTDGRHDWANGCTDLSSCYWPVVFHGAAVGSLHPDIPVQMSFADYSNGIDPELAAIRADIARRAGGGSASPNL